MNALTKDFTDAVEAQFKSLNEDVQRALKDANTANGIIHELEQKMARPRSGDYSPISAGQKVAESDEIKALAERASSQPARVKVEVKNITTAPTSGGALDNTMRDPNVNGLPGRTPRIRNLLTVLDTNSGNVEYVAQTTRDNQAAMQVEGELKAQSDYAWEIRNLPIRTIAHWVPASVQVLADAPQLRSIIDTELRYGLALKEDEQLLNGSGTGVNLTGLVTEATAFADPLSLTDPTMIDTVGVGMLQVSLADYTPNGVVMHPSDWMRIRLLKDADGKYLLGDPQSNPNPLLFGLPVVATTAMPIDKFLIGDFRAAATLYDREEANVVLSTEHADFFVRNLVAIRAEERLGLAIKNPLALSYGDFGNA
ncbi:phage major capsid protein [Qipengyuania spongiae]|uniref:Phage major capsid protein n=1 Tax=Qipengyuania spongiae TaxID=2909673 RepID=A0ABY5T1W7_9SPHN|nr:phage major capsid protein [Qipengyuania spongiae]UVI39246.1 phage major capsid protein [Qipengyuania spongiae]